jgi:S1-C subfamily serine protease
VLVLEVGPQLRKAGLENNDVIVGEDGAKIDQASDLLPALQNAKTAITLRVYRNQQEIKLNLPR